MTIKDDEIIYIAVDEGFRFFKLEDGLAQFADQPQFIPDFTEMTSSFKISDTTFILRCLIAYELDHANHWNDGIWKYYKCTFVDSRGEPICADFNNLYIHSLGFKTYHGGHSVTKLKFELFGGSSEDEVFILDNQNLLPFIRKFLFAIQIANTIEEFKKGMLVYDLLYRFYGKFGDVLYDNKYKLYPGQMRDLSKHMPIVTPNHRERFFSVADNYERHLDSIKEYLRLRSQITDEINPNFWK